MKRKVLENKQRQHGVVTAHKRKIRDEINPRLRAAKRAHIEASKRNKLTIRQKWNESSTRVKSQQREQQRKHRAIIIAHKRRIKAEVAKRQ